MARRTVELHFAGSLDVQLIETRFSDLSLDIERVAVRGKTGGAVRNAGSFQWTSAVRALCVLMLKAAISKNRDVPESELILLGGQGSLAASLDFAISKQPAWLTDMFGTDSGGIAHVRRFVLRSNPERKRPGPVVLRFNQVALEMTEFKIFREGRLVDSAELAEQLLKQIVGESRAINRDEEPVGLAA